jgi:hypothetical protein
MNVFGNIACTMQGIKTPEIFLSKMYANYNLKAKN